VSAKSRNAQLASVEERIDERVPSLERLPQSESLVHREGDSNMAQNSGQYPLDIEICSSRARDDKLRQAGCLA